MMEIQEKVKNRHLPNFVTSSKQKNCKFFYGSQTVWLDSPLSDKQFSFV